MASSLREAATRLLRPAGEALRLLVDTPKHSGSTRALEEGYRAAQIQQKKEELYDLIARAQAQAKKLDRFSDAYQRDRFVLKVLCTHIKPRPHDPQWRFIKTAKRVTIWGSTAINLGIGAITLPALARYQS